MLNVLFRKSKNAWFATNTELGHQKQIRLANAPSTNDGKKLAEVQLIQELAARNINPEPDDGAKTPACLTVSSGLRGFLQHSREEHAPHALASGVADATVATLLGHTNTQMLRRFYARLSYKIGDM